LATPLIFEDEVIGVLEFVNRTGEPPFDPFTPEEMDGAAVYAEAIAALVNAFLASQLTADLAARICEEKDSSDIEAVTGWIEDLKGKQEHKDLLELAVLVKEVSEKSDQHRKLCKEILESIIKFGGGNGGFEYSEF
jgi:tryptophan 2,3-dioxygenase